MRFIIKNYINKINVHDIVKFGEENDIYLSLDEANVLKTYLKNNWEDLLYDDPCPIINDMKCKLGDKAFEIEKLFYYYKEEYKSYV